MIYFPPLPGSPEFNDDSNLSNIIKSVTEDLESLQTNGIDEIMFGNRVSKFMQKVNNIRN